MSKEKTEPAFSKEQLKRSLRYREECDIIEALFSDEELYTHKEAEGIIEAFKTKKTEERKVM